MKFTGPLRVFSPTESEAGRERVRQLENFLRLVMGRMLNANRNNQIPHLVQNIVTPQGDQIKLAAIRPNIFQAVVLPAVAGVAAEVLPAPVEFLVRFAFAPIGFTENQWLVLLSRNDLPGGEQGDWSAEVISTFIEEGTYYRTLYLGTDTHLVQNVGTEADPQLEAFTTFGFGAPETAYPTNFFNRKSFPYIYHQSVYNGKSTLDFVRRYTLIKWYPVTLGGIRYYIYCYADGVNRFRFYSTPSLYGPDGTGMPTDVLDFRRSVDIYDYLGREATPWIVSEDGTRWYSVVYDDAGRLRITRVIFSDSGGGISSSVLRSTSSSANTVVYNKEIIYGDLHGLPPDYTLPNGETIEDFKVGSFVGTTGTVTDIAELVHLQRDIGYTPTTVHVLTFTPFLSGGCCFDSCSFWPSSYDPEVIAIVESAVGESYADLASAQSAADSYNEQLKEYGYGYPEEGTDIMVVSPRIILRGTRTGDALRVVKETWAGIYVAGAYFEGNVFRYRFGIRNDEVITTYYDKGAECPLEYWPIPCNYDYGQGTLPPIPPPRPLERRIWREVKRNRQVYFTSPSYTTTLQDDNYVELYRTEFDLIPSLPLVLDTYFSCSVRHYYGYDGASSKTSFYSTHGVGKAELNATAREALPSETFGGSSKGIFDTDYILLEESSLDVLVPEPTDYISTVNMAVGEGGQYGVDMQHDCYAILSETQTDQRELVLHTAQGYHKKYVTAPLAWDSMKTEFGIDSYVDVVDAVGENEDFIEEFAKKRVVFAGDEENSAIVFSSPADLYVFPEDTEKFLLIGDMKYQEVVDAYSAFIPNELVPEDFTIDDVWYAGVMKLPPVEEP